MYDMRNDLNPRRVTIAMWDLAYMTRRNPQDPFKDWEQCLDDVKERGFNTVRIDAFPGVINPRDLDSPFTWEKNPPYQPWLWADTYTCSPGRDLLAFIQLAAKKGINVTLSSWWMNSRFVPENMDQAAEIWSDLLHVIKRECGFDNILFTDLCNEIPGFLPGYSDQLNALRENEKKIIAQQGSVAPIDMGGLSLSQLHFLKTTMDHSLGLMQREFPDMKFTYSMNMNEDFAKADFQNLDVLDIHFFLSDRRFDDRTRFGEFTATAYEDASHFKDFSHRAQQTIQTVGPQLRQKQRNQLAWGKAFSEKIGAPLITSEAWASWFYVDHPDLDWEWLLDWCELLIGDAVEFGLWGITTNNYAEPHFQLWKDVKWHQRLNEKFLRG